MEIRESVLDERTAEAPIALSVDWERENGSYGCQRDEREDLEGDRIFLAEENGEIIGYLLGNLRKSGNQSAVIPDGTDYFEVRELYVKPACRSQGVGSALFRF